jgi:hypothetical protein
MGATSSSIARRGRRGGLVGPVIIVSVGIMLLLNSTGLIGWQIWDSLWRLWPVLVIALGLDLLLGRSSARRSAVISLVLIMILLPAAWFSSRLQAAEVAGVEWVDRPLTAATRANVEIGMGAGRLRISATERGMQLIEGTVEHRANERIFQSYDVREGRAYYSLYSRTIVSGPFSFWTRNQGVTDWDLRLGNGIPTELRISTGGGQSDIDLKRVQVTGLELDTGKGQARVVLPAQGKYAAVIRGGAGPTDIVIPANVAARVEVSADAGAVEIEGNFQREGDVYISPDYEMARAHVDLQVSGEAGQIMIVQADE